MKTKELTVRDREEISRMLFTGAKFAAIGRAIGKTTSCISREVSRHGFNRFTYRSFFAQQCAIKKKRSTGRKRKLDKPGELRDVVFQWLEERWSPVQIVERLKMEYPGRKDMKISSETIYSYLYVHPKETLRRKLILGLRRQHKQRRKKGRVKNIHEKRGKIPDMTSIEERPREIDERIVPGHWEGDLIMGKYQRSAIGTLTERTTRFTLIVPMKDLMPEGVCNAFAEQFKAIPKELKQTLTYDQGKEMKKHKAFTKRTKIKVYFAHARSPWERGTNENTNGLIRQYFPKGTDFNTISRKKLKQVQAELNGRPRKCLGFLKPIEVFNNLLQ